MSTYGTMKTRIADEFVNESITTAQIENAIKSAVKHYEREAFWFNQKVGTFATVAAQEYYTTAANADIPDIVRIDSMRSSEGNLLRAVSFDHIEQMQDGSVTSPPGFYTRYKDQIRLYPIPDAVYTMTMAYIYKLTTLSADADTNAWTDECEEMIRQASKRILSTDILHADDMAQRYAELERVAYDRIRSENKDRSPQKLLRADGIPVSGNSFDVNRGW
jgi:hypothetical protein